MSRYVLLTGMVIAKHIAMPSDTIEIEMDTNSIQLRSFYYISEFAGIGLVYTAKTVCLLPARVRALCECHQLAILE